MTNEQAINEIGSWIDADGVGKISIVALSLACDALKEKQERENPIPLTKKQFREMQYEPVWCESIEDDKTPYHNEWVVFTDDVDLKYYGVTWVAYKYEHKRTR